MFELIYETRYKMDRKVKVDFCLKEKRVRRNFEKYHINFLCDAKQFKGFYAKSLLKKNSSVYVWKGDCEML